MNIINFGGRMPERKHKGDAGADVYALRDYLIGPHQTAKIPLGFGTEIPEGYVGFILPRSSMAARGLIAHAVPVDSNYRGEIHAIITNLGYETATIEEGDRIAQLVIVPCQAWAFNWIESGEASETDRGSGAFGSTGR
jgi:dUTP pyrophosphatase